MKEYLFNNRKYYIMIDIYEKHGHLYEYVKNTKLSIIKKFNIPDDKLFYGKYNKCKNKCQGKCKSKNKNKCKWNLSDDKYFKSTLFISKTWFDKKINERKSQFGRNRTCRENKN